VREALLVFLGGGAGSVLRWLTGHAALRVLGPQFPFGTLAVNVLGCLIMGVLFRALPVPADGGQDARLLLMTGLLGGYTTFSAFALDTASLWMRNEPGLALAYVAASVLLSLTGVAAGLVLGKWMMG
jgi:CrcB protein